MKHEIIRSVDKIEREVWDSLVTDPSQLWGWFKTIERHFPDLIPNHIIINDNAGNILAILPVFIQKTDIYSTLHKRLYPYIHHIMRFTPVSFYGKLVAYTPGSFNSEALIREGIEPKIVYDYLKENVFGKDINMISLPYMSKDTINSIKGRNLIVFPFEIDTFMDVTKFRTFDDYVALLKKNKRLRLSKEFGKAENEGVSFRVKDNLKGREPELSKLFYNIYLKYMGHKTNPFKEEFFADIHKYMDGKLKFFIAEKHGRLVAFNMVFLHKKSMSCFKVGRDYINTDNCTYFNVAYYKPIEYAIKHNIKVIHMGPSSYESKIQRGFSTKELFFVLSLNSSIRRFLLRKILLLNSKKYFRYTQNILAFEEHMLKKWGGKFD